MSELASSGFNAVTSNAVTDFRALHVPGSPLLMPNPWDVGIARVLVDLGFAALATTSSGHAATLGKLDGQVGRDEAIAHGAALAAAVAVPVSADLENGFADDPAGVAATVEAAAATPLQGCSIEDRGPGGTYPMELAVERVAAAAKAAGGRLVLTARAEGFLLPDPDLADVVARLQRFAEVGADVVYAPGLTRPDDIATVVAEVDRPVNVLLRPGGPTVAQLADLGVARISVGGALAFAGLGALASAARELLDGGPTTFWDDAAAGAQLARRAFG
jgi:2-methylisocitrate lyase-like PEP mutase family enzyme